MKIAIIGTYPPRKCGIATFTHDSYKALLQVAASSPSIISISDGSEDGFPPEVAWVVDRDQLDSYLQTVRFINSTFDVCIIQHEYGIFGGEAGNYILRLAELLNVPIVCNFHTVLKDPSAEEKKVLQQLAQLSQNITVMTEYAIEMLKQLYLIPPEKIVHIPHGVPTFDYQQERAKQALGLADKKVMLSFGFLGPNKGFETAIEAVANVENENFRYIILGTTHPNILKVSGESYRQQLQQKATDLGISHKVEFINCFASEKLLVQYLSACDIYVTPYPQENQISSGTLSFALGAGAAVLSTPYWYAKDLLANKRGLLFDFRDVKGLSHLINRLLDNPELLRFYRKNAANYGRKMSWPNIGNTQMALLQQIVGKQKKRLANVNFLEIPEKLTAMLTPAQKKLSY